MNKDTRNVQPNPRAVKRPYAAQYMQAFRRWTVLHPDGTPTLTDGGEMWRGTQAEACEHAKRLNRQEG
jgi:hypothetical protein